MKKKESDVNGVKRWQSIGVRIIGMVVACIFLSVSITGLLVLSNTEKTLKTTIENSMIDIVDSAKKQIDILVQNNGEDVLTVDTLTYLYEDAGITGFDTSYAYVVDTDGIFRYSKREDKIGTQVLNEYVLSIIDKINNGGEYEAEGIFHYTDENGDEKYAAYSVSDQTNWIIVVLASEEDVLSSIQGLRLKLVVSCIIIVIIFADIAYVVARGIIKSLRELTRIVTNTASLDFREDDKLNRLCGRSDEIGVISRESKKMAQSLKHMVNNLGGISGKLNDNALALNETTAIINSASGDNSATAEELAAIMQETSATAENINANVESIKDNTNEISGMSVDALKVADKLIVTATRLNDESVETKNNAMEVCDDMKDKTAKSIEKSKAVEKIGMLTNTIMSIADQTSLLSLNASIEAARAGEHGKGFAVVAGEIGTLASQSSEAVQSIIEIVKEVQDAVDDMSECLKMTADFVENKVVNDYNNFLDASVEYHKDASEVKDAMEIINEKLTRLNNSSNDIAVAVSDINKTIGEAAIGVTDIAEKTTGVVSSAITIKEMVDETSEFSNELKNIVDSFVV